MLKTCIFCGNAPARKNKEHVVPEWLIKLTGDPKRQVTFGTRIAKHSPRSFAFDQLTFPSCTKCNSKFEKLETKTKPILERVLDRKPLGAIELNTLLNWLDKVRIGLWLGLRLLDGNPFDFEPLYFIADRIGRRDRSVGFAFIEGRHPGINFVGAESPLFALGPTTMCTFVNDVALFNSATLGLCGRRVGFPHPTEFSKPQKGKLEFNLNAGLERIIRPIDRQVQPLTATFVYQPIFEHDEATLAFYDNDYVRNNSLDFDAGLGALFGEYRSEVFKLGPELVNSWMPMESMSVGEVYRIARRWAYKKLEQHHREQLAPNIPKFVRTHKKMLKEYEEILYS